MSGLRPGVAIERPLRFCALLLVLAASLTLAACHGPMTATDSTNVELTVAPQPAHTGPVTVTIRITNSSAKPVTHARIMVEADMTHPGMSPVFGSAPEISPGFYEAHIVLNMRGDWVVLSHIRLTNDQKLERQIDVKGVQAN